MPDCSPLSGGTEMWTMSSIGCCGQWGTVKPAVSARARPRHVTANPQVGQRDQRLVGVMPLVSDDLQGTGDRQHRFDSFCGTGGQRLDHCRRITGVRVREGYAHQYGRLQVHGVLSHVNQVGVAVLHLRDLRVGVMRMGRVVVRLLLRPFPVQAHQFRRSRRRNVGRGGESPQKRLVACTGVPADDGPQRRIRFQRGRIDAGRLPFSGSWNDAPFPTCMVILTLSDTGLYPLENFLMVAQASSRI